MIWERRNTTSLILDLQTQVDQLQQTIKALPSTLNPPPTPKHSQKK
jgi:hypothetical protein